LPLSRMSEINTDVHASWSVQSRIKTLNVIGSDENKPVGKAVSISGIEGANENCDAPAFHGIQTSQEATQA